MSVVKKVVIFFKSFLRKIMLLIMTVLSLLIGSIITQGHTWRDLIAMTDALYFESAINESVWGSLAIASNITNRWKSRYFPDYIYQVVYQGYRGQSSGGCQYSFACDGLPETARILEKIPARKIEIERYWGTFVPYERRWLFKFVLATSHLSGLHYFYDPTGGSTHYWTGRDPYWVGDCTNSKIKIGSHTFCRSKYHQD